MAEVDDGEAFAPYATPDPEVVKMKAQRRQLEEQNLLKNSENQKLLKDVLQDLSGDDSPPEIPKQNFVAEDDQKVTSRSSVGSSNLSTSKESQKVGLATISFAFYLIVILQKSRMIGKPKTSPELDRVKLKPVSSTTSTQEDVKNKFPVLKSPRHQIAPMEKPATELSQIRLKKTGDWKV